MLRSSQMGYAAHHWSTMNAILGEELTYGCSDHALQTMNVNGSVLYILCAEVPLMIHDLQYREYVIWCSNRFMQSARG